MPDTQLWDYIHLEGFNETFFEADKLKLNGDYEGARQIFTDILKIAASFPDSIYSVSQIAYIDTKLQRMDELSETLEVFGDLISSGKEIPDAISGDYHYSMVSLELFKGNVDNAFAHMDSTFLYYNQVYPEDHWKLIQANNTLGHLLFDFDLKLDKAFEPWTKAYFDVIPLNVPEHLKAEIYTTMIWYNFAMRNVDNATEFADLAIDALRRPKFSNPDLLAKALSAKAICIKKMRERMEAQELFEEAKELSKEAHELFKEAFDISQNVNTMVAKRVLIELMYNYYQMEDQPELAHYDSLMYVYELESPGNLYLYSDQHLGLRAYIQNKTEESAPYYEQLLASWRSGNITLNSLVLMEAFYILSVAYNKPENVEKSIEWNLRKLRIYAEVNDSIAADMIYFPVDTLLKFKNSFVSTELLARQFYLQYQFSGDLEHLRRSCYYYDVTDQIFLKGLISNDQSSIKTFFTDLGYRFYTNAITVQLELRKSDPQADKSQIDDLVFNYFERLKSHLWLRNSANKDELGRLSQEIDQLVWKNARYGLSISEKKVLTNLKIKYLVTTDSLQKLNNKHSLDVNYAVNSSQSDVKRVLTENDVLISYNLFNNRIQIAALTLDTIVFSDVSYGDELKLLDSLRACLVARTCPYDRFSNYSSSVRKLLLDPVQEILVDKERMIIVPDRKINLIPFEVLLEDTLGTNYSNASYLIKSKEIIYSPSCKIYSTYSQVQFQPENLIAFYYGDDLGGLPCAKYEISAIEKVFPGGRSRIFNSRRSSSKKFLNELESPSDIIHVSLHAKSTDLSIFDNYILFGSQFEDTLYGFELSHRNIEANLVVLSACESGYGYYRDAEGMYSLTRYIQQAGASRVLSSLWVVDDCIASKILQTFYESLTVDSDPGRAIRLAKLKHLSYADDLMAFPGYWAAMVLID